MFSKALCARFDSRGRTGQQALLRCIDISSGGARFASNFLVALGQMLEFTMPLGPNIILFRGTVVHVTPSQDQRFEFGVQIEHIEAEDRIALTRFIIRKCRETTCENRILRVAERPHLQPRNLA
jgi:hypothetical protein